MSRVVYKYPINPGGSTYLNLPEGAMFLDVQTQHEMPVSWWLVDPNAYAVNAVLTVLGTGLTVSDQIDEAEYLGTFQMFGGDFVGHLFRAKE